MFELIFSVVALLASFLSVIFGIASGMLLLPIATLFIETKKAIAIVTVFYIATNINKIIMFWRYARWRVILLIWLGSVPFVVLGAFLLSVAPSLILRKVLGIMILLYVIYDFTGISKKIRLTDFRIVAISTLYGFFAGVVGTAGVIKAALLNQLGFRKEKFLATMAFSALLLNLIKSFIYSKFSLISISDFPLIIALIVSAFLGGYLGKIVLKYITPENFRKMLLIALAFLSLYLIIF